MRGMPRKLPLKRHHSPAHGWRNIFNRLYIQNGLSHAAQPRTLPFDSPPQTLRDNYEVFG